MPLDELLVGAILGNKVVMVALFNHFTLAKDNDLVSVADRGESMGNHDARLLLGRDKSIEGLLHLVLTLSVQGTRGLVEEKHRRLAHKGPGDGDSLLLTTGEAETSFTNDGFVALREELLIVDEGESVGLAASIFHHLVEVGVGEASLVDTIHDVLADRAREENRFLLHQSDLLLMVPLIVKVLNVLALVEELAICRVVKTFNK